jgi:hypothetical protein
MAMQQSGKGPGDGKAPNLSDEQADQFASSFTPAWDADDGLGDDTNGTANATIVDAPAVPAADAHVPLHKQTLMGVASPANAPAVDEIRPIVPSSEAIDPENILESKTAPQPAIAAKSVPPPAPPPAPAAAAQPLMKTQLMQGAPGPVAAQPKAQAKPVARSAQPQPQKAAVALSADPFKRPDDDDDVVPKKSNKTLIFVVAGLAVAAGIGLVAKFAMSDDPPKAATTTQAVGPAVATAEIPPPPPKVDTPPPTPPPPTPVVAAVTAVKAPEPLAAPPVLAAPPSLPAAPAAGARPTPVAADPAPHRQPRTTPPPQAAAPPPLPPAASPKTPPKGANTGIVRDNPF